MFAVFTSALMLSVAAASNATILGDGSGMDCGSAPYCGVLTLETGDGDGNYIHEFPQLHGLWPQVGHYGTSECMTPGGKKGANVKNDMDCYTDATFAQHEWDAHGICAANEPSAFFQQACSLSKSPVATMKTMKANGDSLQDMAAALEKQGYEVVFIDTHESQLELACCAGHDGKWKMSAVKDFGKNCGGK